MFLTPTLTVDLPAIVANWQALRAQFTGNECAAVVKADAYGLGMVPVAQALAQAGCHTFFVATIEEGIALRAALADVRILVFHGVGRGEEFALVAHRLIPVLSSRAQIERWKPVAAEHVHAISALHVDTAMARMGLQPEECVQLLENEPTVLEACRIGLLMSHFACAPEPDHPLNARQLALFNSVVALAPSIPASLCNSGGIFLPRDYHFHLARPGCSLYGIAPQQVPTAIQTVRSASEPERSERGGAVAGASSPPAAQPLIKQVATWQAPVLTVRTITQEQTVGYGATATAVKGTRIATVASGYADGYLRHLSGKGVGYLGEHRVPLIGRVTMDMLCFDVTGVPESAAHEGAMLTLLGDKAGIRVDEVAQAADTIGYEILTRIGARVKRVYTPLDATATTR
jgi:alanine racemase